MNHDNRLNTSALQGIKVLELARVSPAAYCTMVLGDLGADVLKVEAVADEVAPAEGASAVSPRREEGRLQAAHYALNRNKKSLAVDLKSPQGRQIFLKLCEVYDVVLECFRPGAVNKLGIGYEAVSKVNPRIVYCSLSGYGQSGPYRDLSGHDINYIAMAGALHLMGRPGQAPVVPLNLVGDLAGGALFAAVGIMAALISRNTTGRGQYIDSSFTDGVISLVCATPSAWDFFRSGMPPAPGVGAVAGEFPYNNVYETKEGRYITIACVEPKFWGALCETMERRDLVSRQNETGKEREEVFAILRRMFLTRTSDDWFSLLSARRIPVGKVNHLGEVFQDEHFRQREMAIEVRDDRVGKITQVGMPVKLSGTPGSVRRLSPIIGEHTKEVLAGLGYSEREISELHRNGTVSSP
ncbi:MAG: CoA transferase [Chloroflexi bacterium]|nr:CoA transferase [Chloroflexota bacterium]